MIKVTCEELYENASDRILVIIVKTPMVPNWYLLRDLNVSYRKNGSVRFGAITRTFAHYIAMLWTLLR